MEKLKFKKKNVFQKSFERKNLIYVVRKIEDKQNYLIIYKNGKFIVEDTGTLIGSFNNLTKIEKGK